VKIFGWPRRTIRLTRDGFWFLFATLGLGLAAVNTGNNLVYLLCSMLLALILVSGTLSELTLRGLRFVPILPDAFYAGRPALLGATLASDKRHLASYAVSVQVGGPAGDGVLHVPVLEAGGERILTWEATLPRRGRHRLPGVRLATRFPFGLFLKSEPVALEGEVLVFPAIGPVRRDRLQRDGEAEDTAARRRGRGHDLYNLRHYRSGDDPRLIHWRSSAKTDVLTVRELEEDIALDVRLVLEGRGAGDPTRLEAALSEAASLAVHFLRAGAGVALAGAGLGVGLGRGRAQERRILTALALYDPDGPAAGDGRPPGAGRAMREIRIDLG
jgi:uncharacterized protein (DUF58 family)